MRFAIAAAGTGGHVYPGLAVGEALVDAGVPRRDVLYLGGSRLESEVFPREGFPFAGMRLSGLKRSLSPSNLAIPLVVWRARRVAGRALSDFGASVLLAMGGYVSIPTALASRSLGVTLMNAEQNAEAGLANRVVSRWAERTFTSFPHTAGLEGGECVGNPVRKPFWRHDRDELRPGALRHYGLSGDRPVLGVFGGSLGAERINEAVARVAARWAGPEMDIVHLVGGGRVERYRGRQAAGGVTWRTIGFEESMELFYAASDLVVARAGGAVAELTATATPAVLVPGAFGSSGHQQANAARLERAGAAVVLHEDDLARLDRRVSELLFDRQRIRDMRTAARGLGRPGAARDIATAMMAGSSS